MSLDIDTTEPVIILTEQKIMVDKSTDTDDLPMNCFNRIPINLPDIKTNKYFSNINQILSDAKSDNVFEYIQILKGLASLYPDHSVDTKYERDEIMRQKRRAIENVMRMKTLT